VTKNFAAKKERQKNFFLARSCFFFVVFPKIIDHGIMVFSTRVRKLIEITIGCFVRTRMQWNFPNKKQTRSVSIAAAATFRFSLAFVLGVLFFLFLGLLGQ
jgi:hypothetical protein